MMVTVAPIASRAWPRTRVRVLFPAPPLELAVTMTGIGLSNATSSVCEIAIAVKSYLLLLVATNSTLERCVATSPARQSAAVLPN